jgi:hypothetical protein
MTNCSQLFPIISLLNSDYKHFKWVTDIFIEWKQNIINTNPVLLKINLPHVIKNIIIDYLSFNVYCSTQGNLSHVFVTSINIPSIGSNELLWLVAKNSYSIETKKKYVVSIKNIYYSDCKFINTPKSFDLKIGTCNIIIDDNSHICDIYFQIYFLIIV